MSREGKDRWKSKAKKLTIEAKKSVRVLRLPKADESYFHIWHQEVNSQEASGSAQGPSGEISAEKSTDNKPESRLIPFL